MKKIGVLVNFHWKSVVHRISDRGHPKDWRKGDSRKCTEEYRPRPYLNRKRRGDEERLVQMRAATEPGEEHEHGNRKGRPTL